ncbi:MAG: MBOAT family protein [Eubacterium sp.]|nr:MBOAT family protein [Eubacterium sp.]
MVFSSTIFLFAFLPALVALYFLASKKYRNYVLLFFSLVFYAWGEPKFLFVMLTIVGIDYLAAFAIDFLREKYPGRKLSGLVLFLAIASNVGVLGYYKYTVFVLRNFNKIFSQHIAIPKIVLPIGISFFTFQAMSYVIDVYRKEVKPQKNPFFVLLYVSLFPQLVAGPIVRYQTVENEITERSISINDLAAGVERFIVGLAKKVMIANYAGQLADIVFDGDYLTTPYAWLGAAAYTIQIYFDFSAYSDMAIGLGRIFGFHFNENFNYPYISKSITEFWRRWHISLSTWFRDYIYIPLGGNRCGRVRQIFNMFVVWAVTGFWHGAAWNFILWGIYYFILLFIEKNFLLKILDKIPGWIRHIYVMLAVIVGWVLFRVESLAEVIAYLKVMFSFHFERLGTELCLMYLSKYGIYLALGIILSAPVYKKLREHLSKKCKGTTRELVMAGGYCYLALLFGVTVLYLVNSTYNPFIYFRF